MGASFAPRASAVISSDRIPEPRMAKADLRKPESDENRQRIAKQIDSALARWDLKTLSELVKRDERQIARWKTGAERPQLDALLEDAVVYRAVLLALFELDPAADVQTTVSVKARTVIACVLLLLYVVIR